MPLFRNPVILSLAGHPVRLRGAILVPFAQGLPALFQEFKTLISPPWPPTDYIEADKLVRDFGAWCSTVKLYTVILDEDVIL